MGSQRKACSELRKLSARMSTQVEVTRGVFDPRTYREADPVNWARKRRSDWLAIPGKIHYVRERTVDSQERELEEQARKEEEVKLEEQKDLKQEEAKEIVKEVVKEKEPMIEKKKTEFWPREKRSDITLAR